MKAFAIDSYKGDLRMRDVPDPAPGPNDVVVAIAATSVNPLDVKLREGAFKAILPYRMPLVLSSTGRRSPRPSPRVFGSAGSDADRGRGGGGGRWAVQRRRPPTGLDGPTDAWRVIRPLDRSRR